MAAVNSQLRALNSRVKDLKGKMARFEEHYDDHLKKGSEFQDAVARLLAKFGKKKQDLMSEEVDEKDMQAVKDKIDELEVSRS